MWLTVNELSLIDFYRKNEFSPVRQEIPDLNHHFERRASLYRNLGILPAFIHGRTVLEVGPGSGHNSLFTASLKPEQFILIEPNPQGVNDIHDLFNQYHLWSAKIKVISQTIEEYQDDRTYDFVFCEGLLGAAGVPDPGFLFKALAKFVSPGGVLIITCMNETATLSELLRRLIAHMLLRDGDTLNEKVMTLLPIFSPHLAQLHGMTRRHDDWIIDNLINPTVCGQLFTIPDALSTLPDQFEFYASSPHFVSDWRWYKDIYGKEKEFTQRALNQYWANFHNFIDYRYVFPPRDVLQNIKLYQLCKSIRLAIQKYEREKSDKILSEIQKNLQECIIIVREFSPETASAMSEALNLISHQPLEAAHVAKMTNFAAWFGRGQQYISLNRLG
jgi:2-polyprenyl-3-methyl-5-hydroxy-6-metoxy-1,4-benzoquinol methylase